MQKCTKHILSTAVIMLCFLHSVYPQICNLPILSNFNNTTQSEFNAIWIDFNSNVEFYEIEFGIKSFIRTLEPNITNITSNNYTFQSLLPGTTYEIYLRTVCDTDNKSDWNGPYFNNTNIDNESSCALSLGITDNNCPIRNTYNIEVSGYDNKILGTDINIENIALAIEHTWPPDLYIALTSPNGKSAILSSHNGNGIDNYGIPSTNCNVNANFNDKACISISDWIPPFQGNFNAEEELASAFDGDSANGIWQLSICDRAAGDVGQLTHINLEFSTETCQAPQDFIISDIEGTTATFKWKNFDNCSTIKLTYNEIGAPPEEVFIDIVDCISESFIATGLKPGTLYELNVNTECQEGLTSNPLCAVSFQTRCSDSDFKETFDEKELCDTNCDSICNLVGIWNLNNKDSKGWFVQNGDLSNSFTGPQGDKNNQGKFIQIDPALNCINNKTAIVNTECLNLENINECAISFFYHMFGKGVGSLFLEYTLDNEQWQILWEVKGNQGDEWIFESIGLEVSIPRGRLRFRAESNENNNQGIIALDHIKLYNTENVNLNIYYQDLDKDGYGNPDSIQLFCSDLDLFGYSKNRLDCNDQNDKINPDAQEVSCNQIDENCNGPSDDAQTIDIDININSVIDESCRGSSDGSIEIVASLGIPPFEYEWSNGSLDAINNNLTTGVYTCTVTSSNGCQTISSPIFVGFENILVYNVNNIENSSCQGEEDGSITINVAGGTEPYNIIWENGSEGLTSSNLSAGIYAATITGSNGCELTTDPIEVLGSQIITTGVAIKNDIDCFGDSTGFIQLGIIGGTSPYNILWDTGDSTAFIDELKAGFYSVTITDTNGCFNSIENIQIEEPSLLEVNLNRKRNVICNGDSNAQIDINVNGGTPPYSYFWSNGIFTQDLFNLSKGNYSVTITDFKACSAVLNDIYISEPESFEITLDSISSVSCSGSKEGFVRIEVNGGTAPYIYNWSTSDGINSMESSLNSLLPGQYFVTIVDAFGCKSLPGKFEVNNQNIPINISLSQLNKIDCHSDSTASLIALSESNNLPLDFNWSAGVKNIKDIVSDTLTLLIQGTYNITITDSEGCVGVSDSISIEQPNEINYEVTNLTNNNCFAEENGSIVLEANGGTGALEYNWNNNSMSNINSNLQNGIYQVTINDALGCEAISEEINITSPENIVIDADITPSSENMDGTITLSVSGGVAPYNYTWNPLSVGSDSLLINLSTGTYSVTITDAHNCFVDTTLMVDFVSSISYIKRKEIIKFYPNPVDNFLQVDCLTNDCNLQLYVIDITGTVRKQINLTRNEKIDLSDLDNGLYFLECRSRSNYQLSKIIVFH